MNAAEWNFPIDISNSNRIKWLMFDYRIEHQSKNTGKSWLVLNLFDRTLIKTIERNWTPNAIESVKTSIELNMEIYWIFLFDWCWIEFGNQTSIVRLSSTKFDWFVNRKVWLTSPGKKLHGACNNVTPLNPYIIRQLNQWHVAYIEFCKGLKFKLQFLIF